jgi:hypothetical protein
MEIDACPRSSAADCATPRSSVLRRGKTAIVEGIAQRFAADAVPSALRGSRIISIQPSNLVAGAGVVGELEKRWQAVLAEARQPGIILFIDELHTIVGSGGMAGTTDVGALLKPALGRGDIAVIGATTDDEYRRFIERDRASSAGSPRSRCRDDLEDRSRSRRSIGTSSPSFGASRCPTACSAGSSSSQPTSCGTACSPTRRSTCSSNASPRQS